MSHPDSELIRRLLVGRIDRSEGNALTQTADDQAGDLSEVPRIVRMRLKTAPHGGTTAPVAAQTPRPAAGAFINSPVHGENCGN